jgi:hypothetical protein
MEKIVVKLIGIGISFCPWWTIGSFCCMCFHPVQVSCYLPLYIYSFHFCGYRFSQYCAALELFLLLRDPNWLSISDDFILL